MPVISAISGNVGLQAAAITVRAVDSKLQCQNNLVKSIGRELAMDYLMIIIESILFKIYLIHYMFSGIEKWRVMGSSAIYIWQLLHNLKGRFSNRSLL